MQGLSRVMGLCAALCLGFWLTVGTAAEPKITLLLGTDLPGFDYAVIKGTTQNACQASCADDRVCRAFTFNTKAKWCFLKGAVGPETPEGVALSGRVDHDPNPILLEAQRISDLPFPALGMVEDARRFLVQLPVTLPPPRDAVYADLVADAEAAAAADDPAGAMISFQQALAIMANDPAVWAGFAAVTLDRADAEAARTGDNNSYALATTATHAALNGFLRAESVAERANALALLAHAFELRSMWPETIATYRTSLELVDNASLQATLETVVAQHGFRISSHEVDSESASPRICAVFSESLPGGDTDLSGYVVIDGAPQAAISTESRQICADGLEHGRRYHLRFRAGLPAASGEMLRDDVELDAYVPDRKPIVALANNAYVMPAGLGGGLPITSINATSADIVIYRIGDRSIATAVRNGIFQRTLDGYSAEDVANQYGEQVWEGQIDLAKGAPNAETVTAIPVADVLTDSAPGAYVVTAKVTGAAEEYWREIATQWFIVTDLGLSSVDGSDGVHAFVRALSSTNPIAGAKVRLIAVNNEVLGEAITDANGRADLAPGLSRGTGGRAPQLLIAETADGDYAFLDVTKPAFDLTDRGVEGRASPGPLDLFATTERGVYRPGETVFLTALLRDSRAEAVTGLPLTMEVERPDGVIAERAVLKDAGAGGYFNAMPLVNGAMRGSWHIRLYADPKAAALANIAFLVEDFEPERLAFEVSAPDGPVTPDEVTEITVAAKYLYGATAPDLGIEADAVLRPTTTLKGYPGYTFGRLDDTIQSELEPLGIVGTTDADGNAIAEITLPEPQPTTRPLDVQFYLRLVDTNGRTVERTLTRPVLADSNRIGIKPQFERGDGLAEGSRAGFDVITVAPEGGLVAEEGLEWTLSRIETNYQWYRQSDTWKWEAVTTTRRVADGMIDTADTGPVAVGAQVNWGRYRLEVTSTGENPTSTSYEFYAGYYYAEAGSNTPDTLQVALDKPAYRVGETATLKLDPQFAGTALVLVVDDRIIDMVAVDVPAEGASVELQVTDAWGPGAYVTAMLYRPADASEKRMPSRAIGLAFADVEPGERLLGVSLDAPAVAAPREPFTVKVALTNVAPGATAYVAIAAVDLGILNLTNFKTPDPDGWYFGQRELGMELRDLYGNLIDPTQGAPGALRSGGDEEGSRLGTPPATSVLVALHSGVVTVEADGTATVSFDMPDFAGTVRLMAMAWTPKAVGHAVKDVIVRDPVVITMSPPRFLRLDDTSRLLVEINNISGAPGTYRVELDAGVGLATDAPDTSVDLDQGDRTALDLSLTGTAIGDQPLQLRVTAPNGDVFVKDLTLGVRAASAPVTTSVLIPLAPGASVTLDAAYFADMVPHTGALSLAIGPVARLDVPELLLGLDRYPYGCAEQVSSRALPLLYLNEVARMIGLGDDEALDQRIKDAIINLLAKQTSGGSFGLWGPFSYSDLWLDSYVTEFLLRARDAGYEVPQLAMDMAFDNLSNQLSYASDFEKGGEDIAYALYDLSRAGRAAIGDLRYYYEARLDAFGSALAKAQLGSALALYGDRTRAAKAFAAAVEHLNKPETRGYRPDYGSRLRDTAAVLALAAEFKPSGINTSALAEQLATLRDAARYTSTQEDAWTLVAAAALARQTADGTVTLDGEELTGSVYRRYTQEHFDSADVLIANTANTPTEIKVSVTAIPATPPPATSAGFTITRDYYLPDGTMVDPTDMDVVQNDRFVVVLTMAATSLGSGQYLVADPLPAGFEIENPDLSQGSGVADLSWLSVDQPTHTEARTDQFVAAFRYAVDDARFSAAYMVRAVSPGTFVLPGATVEDMYRPDLRANTEADAIVIRPAGGTTQSAATADDPAPASGKSMSK